MRIYPFALLFLMVDLLMYGVSDVVAHSPILRQSADIVKPSPRYSEEADIPSYVWAKPGNNCVVLRWLHSEDSRLSRFAVYRQNRGTKRTLHGFAPKEAFVFPDATAKNGVTYQYQVVPLRSDGTAFPTISATATPKANLPRVEWIRRPFVDHSGLLRFTVRLNKTVPIWGNVFIDGEAYDEAHSYGTPLEQRERHFDTTTLPNGRHTVQVIYCQNFCDYALMTSAATLMVDNQISERSPPNSTEFGVITPANPRVVYTATRKPTAEPWSVKIYNEDMDTHQLTLLRTFQGQGTKIKVIWDGNDENGRHATGSFFRIVFQSGKGTPFEDAFDMPENR